MRNGIRGIACGRTILAVVLLAAAAARAQDEYGSTVGWGRQVVGGDLSEGFAAVAAGGNHGLGLKADGSIVAWGWNTYGQCDVPDATCPSRTRAL